MERNKRECIFLSQLLVYYTKYSQISSDSSSQLVQLFSKLKDEQPKFRHQIVAIAGDCSEPNLGISSQDWATLIQEVSIVFHVAATVRFDEKLPLAVAINVRSARDVLRLCKEIQDLKVHIHKHSNIQRLFQKDLLRII